MHSLSVNSNYKGLDNETYHIILFVEYWLSYLHAIKSDQIEGLWK